MQKPLTPRQLRARMVLAGLKLKTVCAKAGVTEAVGSQLLNERMLDEVRLTKLRKIIMKAPLLEEAA